LPVERQSVTHKFELAGHEGYIIVGLYPDGTPGEILLHGFGKDGSFIQAMMGVWGKAMSNALQYGQPVHKLITNYLGTNFEPNGWTSSQDIPKATSIPDYIARWMALTFLSEEQRKSYKIDVVPGDLL
jgi:ribonucleoside-diphosphate reductase alpha chain